MLRASKQNLRAKKQHFNLIWVIYVSDLGHGFGTFFYPRVRLHCSHHHFPLSIYKIVKVDVWGLLCVPSYKCSYRAKVLKCTIWRIYIWSFCKPQDVYFRILGRVSLSFSIKQHHPPAPLGLTV